MAYSAFGVENERYEHPAIKEHGIGSSPIDGQRKYLAKGPAAGMGAVNRRKTQTAAVNSSRPGGFKVRKTSKKFY